ncbi:LPP20 family lipoprotein [Psychromonas sp.]|uniref:LPP20 family lipoprotein n=1 Tax=Psychromonas sp. TaxID=1884585 RepID=UPI003567617C
MITRFIFIAAILTSFSAFAVPEWTNNLQPKEGYITGVGIAEDISKAKQSATADIAKTLYANVSSVFSSVAKTSGDSGLLETSSQNQIESKDVLLPNIHWDKIEASDGIYYALASVSKSEIISLYKKNLTMALKPFENIQNKSTLNLNDYLFLLENKKALNISALRASAIASLSSAGEIYYDQIYQLLTKQNQFVDSVCFNVKKSHDRMADKIYLPAIESALQSDRFQLSENSDCLPIKFRSKTERVDKKIAQVSMQLDIGQPVIVSKVIKFAGTSSGSYKSAMFAAAENFSQYFSNHGGLLNRLLNSPDSAIEISLSPSDKV